MEMNLSLIIKQCCRELNVSIAELGRITGQSQQNLGQKINRGTIKFDEFVQFIEALGVNFEWSFTLPNGERFGCSTMAEKSKAKMALLETQVEFGKKSNEYLLSLGGDIRTSLFTAIGNVEKAEKNIKNPEKVADALRKVKVAHNQINEILEEGFADDDTKVDGSGRIFIKGKAIQEEAKRIIDMGLLKNRRVLLVDDNEMNREIAMDTLVDNGLIVEEAVNGKEAVEKVKNAEAGYYSWVLMDIMMPVMNGLKAAENIRKLADRSRANVPIIAMTASAYEEDRKKSIEAGMNAHLAKPIDAAQLIYLMAELL